MCFSFESSSGFGFIKNKKIQIPKSHASFSRIFSFEQINKKVKKYKYLKDT